MDNKMFFSISDELASFILKMIFNIKASNQLAIKEGINLISHTALIPSDHCSTLKMKIRIKLARTCLIITGSLFKYKLVSFPIYPSLTKNDHVNPENRKTRVKKIDKAEILSFQAPIITISLVEDKEIAEPKYITDYDIHHLHQKSKNSPLSPLIISSLTLPLSPQLKSPNSSPHSIKDKSFDEIYSSLIQMKKERELHNTFLNKTVFSIKSSSLKNALRFGVSHAH